MKQACPICGSALHARGPTYDLDTLLASWAPATFSQAVVDEHKRQSAFTRLWVCKHCDFEVFLPRIIGTAGFYESLAETQATGYYFEGIKWDFHEAAEDCRAGQRIVELGCGPGNFLKLASDKGAAVVGSEYNAQGLAMARKRGFDVRGPDDDLSGEHGTFDAAFSFHVLEHVADPRAFLQTMIRLVRRGGRIGISVPNKHGITGYVRPCFSDMPPHHATHWSERSLLELGRQEGLRAERVVFEPLAIGESYYLDHWVANKFPPDSFRKKLFEPVAKRLAPKYVHRLKQLGAKRIFGFKGQSVYVCFKTKD